jgi:hypothetical protein
LSTTGNTNVAIPSVGKFGGIGDKLTLYPRISTTYRYILGMENNALWMSSPNTIKLYNKDANSSITDTSCNGGIRQTPNSILQVGDGARLRISNGLSDYSSIGTKMLMMQKIQE